MQKISITSAEMLTRAFREMMRVKRADRRNQDLDHVAAGQVAGERSRPPISRTGEAVARRAALAFKREQERRQRERAKEEAARREQERRKGAVNEAENALNTARRKHGTRASLLQASLDAMEKKSRAETVRWEKNRARLKAVIWRARG
jgi:hypothetical protein